MITPKVYVVTTGTYDDYRIVAVFATKSAAASFLARPDHHGERIEPYRLYDGDHMPRRETWYEIDRYRRDPKEPFGEVRRRRVERWEFEGPPYIGHRLTSGNFHRWAQGERAWGQDADYVEQLWADAHPDPA